MTELSDRMIEQIEAVAYVTVDRENGTIVFDPDYLPLTMTFDPGNAVEDLVDQINNFNEDKFVLQHTIPRMDPESLPPLRDVQYAAEDCLDALAKAFDQIKSWRKSGMTNKQIKDKLDSGSLSGGLNIDMGNGKIVFDHDHPALHHECGTGKKMTVNEVMKVLWDEWLNCGVGSLICEAIGVKGTETNRPINVLMDESHSLHCTLDHIADMLIEQRDLEQQEECR